MSRTYSFEGIVLKRTNYGEADRIVTIYTKSQGKLKLIAKGVRRPTSRRVGSLETLTWIKATAANGHNLDTLAEVVLVNDYQSIRKNLTKIARAYELVEIVDQLSPENVPNQEVFSTLVAELNKLSSSDRFLDSDIAQAVLRFMQYLGYWPKNKPLDQDWRTAVERIIEKSLKSPRVAQKMVKDHNFEVE